MRSLTITEAARIARMYLDGDRVETLLLDKTGHVDYDFESFNIIKASLMKAERINPDLKYSLILWTERAGKRNIVEPIVCASVLPVEGWRETEANKSLIRALSGEEDVHYLRDNSESTYFPVYNSDHEIVGAIEFLIMNDEANDI